MKSADAPKWRKALDDEYNGIIHKNVVDEIDRDDVPEGVQIVPVRVILTLKDEAEGIRFKAR
jgi:hypothetical protein